MRTRNWMWVVVCGVMLMLSSVPVMAQAQDGGGNQGNQGRKGNRGGGGNFDLAAFRERMMTQIKEQMGITNEDEWKVVQPKLEKVMTAQREARASGMGMFGGGRGPGGGTTGNNPPSDRPQSAVAKAQADLKSALDDKSIGADEIANRLKALRDARQKAKSDYEAAQKELKDVLTQRQEAVLVMAGYLE